MKPYISHVVLKPDQKGLEFYVDYAQAKTVCDLLIQRLIERGPPYNFAQVPQATQFLPDSLKGKEGSKGHALFLFALCLWMRGGVESDTAARFLKKMYEEKPEAFDPSAYKDAGPERTLEQVEAIAGIMMDYRLGQRVEENAAGWVYNMRKLDRFWNGDPRRLMDDRPEFHVMAERIMGKTKNQDGTFFNEEDPNGFMYFRYKMVSMLAYFLMDCGAVPMFYMPVPVDFHVLRLLVSNLVLRVKGMGIEDAVGINFMHERVHRLAREATEWYCREFEISPIALCDSFWLLSRTLCRRNPGNSGYVADAQRDIRSAEQKKARVVASSIADDAESSLGLEFNDDALEALADEDNQVEQSEAPKGRKRYLGRKWSIHQLNMDSKVRRFNESCGICALNEICSYNISSGAYYVGGKLLPERLRFRPMQGHFLDHDAFKGSVGAVADSSVRFAQIELKKY